MPNNIKNPEIIKEQDQIRINFIIKNNASKIRLKERNNNMGEKFLKFNDAIENKNAYLEWQVAYDTKVKKDGEYKLEYLDGDEYIYYRVKKEKIEKKYPAELMVIFKYGLDLGFITKNDINRIIDEIDKIYNEKIFLDNYNIIGKKTENKLYEGFDIYERVLPMSILMEKEYFIEMERKQMQFAAGYQTMIYVCPYLSYLDYNKYSLDNKVSWIVTKENISIFEKIILAFSLASEQHNRDIKELLNIILKAS
ncbi:R.Pab1 restriction endonuclease [Caloramator mitchellensis]|uniref:R.Pab1 restriction endonuclease n=1 Tax=Caloramator mitchellensis TaxID=908809 RepID=A0A0R3JVB1_CALMK|nr:hypothetical protein [Caloramator mitchellensis]KRQ87491.1 R.Pab1 restriction endonuclease [Caloramator mitchellensis]